MLLALPPQPGCENLKNEAHVRYRLMQATVEDRQRQYSVGTNNGKLGSPYR
jgi:hypothetical protein